MNRVLALGLLAAFAAAGPTSAASRQAPPWERPKQVARHLYLENCSICHDLTRPKSPKMGPSLVRFKTSPPAARESLRKYIIFIIRSGGIKMPKFSDVLTEDQMRLLADYVLPDSPR